MPNCFQLFPKGSKEPAVLQRIDEELCGYFNQPVDPVKWLADWYNCIGFRLAMGKTFDDMRQEFAQHIEENTSPNFYKTQIKIIDYLDKHYTSDAFYQLPANRD